ncbi:CPBP family intramembrane metalloprotease, partial [Vibrio cholerae O1]|nr:CPBP family intramembrane metalloprotease [Vibrio cholerae O1]
IAIILIPIYEQIVFRGIIFGYLRKNFNIIGAVLVQALIFGIMHLNLVQGIYTFILGIVLALIYMYSDSILGNITVHII